MRAAASVMTGVAASALLGLALCCATALPASGETRPPCEIGRVVLDENSLRATIIGGRDGLCLVKYGGGQAQRWLAADRLRALPAAGAAGAGPAAPTPGVVVLRPETVNRHVYQADPLGHVVLTVQVNGAPVRFLVDTGATLVSLTREDAEAAGLKHGELAFDQTVHTANGPVHAAFTQLREMRIDGLAVEHVPAAVIDSLKQSVLGMSFLSRLKSFEQHNGALTLTW